MNIRRNPAVLFPLFILLLLSTFFAFSGAASAQPVQKIEYRATLGRVSTASTQPVQKIEYRATFGRVSTASVQPSSNAIHVNMKPNTYYEDYCLSVGIAASNPFPEYVSTYPFIRNNCGRNLGGIQWLYTSTEICGGAAYNGPADSGTVGISSGAFWGPAPYATWWESCDEYVNGKFVGYVPYELSFTLTANQVIVDPQNIVNYLGSGNSRAYTFR